MITKFRIFENKKNDKIFYYIPHHDLNVIEIAIKKMDKRKG